MSEPIQAGRLLTFDVHVALAVAPEKLWPFLGDTQSLNRASGLPVRSYEEKPDPRGGSIRTGSEPTPTGKMVYREYDFEWVRPWIISVERVISSGPMTWLYNRFEVKPQGTGSLLTISYRARARYRFLIPIIRYFFGVSLRSKLVQTYKRIEAELLARGDSPKQPIFPYEIPVSRDPNRLADLEARLRLLVNGEAWVSDLATYLLSAPDDALIKIRPFRLAKSFGIPKEKLLSLFLRGTKAGLFDMHWDLLCPSCRGAKESVSSLKDLRGKAHCPSCNITFGVEFDQSVELTFSPHQTVREVAALSFCSGGPSNTIHIWSQQRIASGDKRFISLNLEAGSYRIYSPQCRQEVRMEVDPLAAASDEVASYAFPLQKNDYLKTGPGQAHFEIFNQDPLGEIVVKWEKSLWLQDIVTAAHASSNQEFRDLYATEALKPGQEIAVRSMVILFTDLKDSTAFYNRKGDAGAFSRVNSHFSVLKECVARHGGAIVKTIGDAVMASFVAPEEGLQAAIEIQNAIQGLNQNFGADALCIKVGLHFGPVLAVNFNERLDFFGKTVNLAARIQGQCEGSDILLSKTFFDFQGVSERVKQAGVQISALESKVKGFDEEVSLVRMTHPSWKVSAE